MGKIPFQDFWDVNPPLVFYLHVIPVWLAPHLGVSPEAAFLGLVFGLLALSVALLSRTQMERSVRPILMFGYLFSSWLAAALNEFGEREHLFSLVLLPYVIRRFYETKPSRGFLAWAFLVGLLGMLKPAFLLLILVAEIFLILQSSKLPSLSLLLALASPAVLYLAIFLRMPYPALRAYFFEQIPLVIKYYTTHEGTWAEIFRLWKHYFYFVPLVVLSLVASFRLSHLTPRPLLKLITLIGGLSFFLVLYAHKTYGYHMIIFDSLLVTGSLLAIHELLSGKSTRHWRGRASAAVVLTLLGALYGGYLQVRGAGIRPEKIYYDSSPLFEPPFQWSKPGDRVVVFSSNPDLAWPMLYRHQLVPGTRYLILYPLGFFNLDPARKRALAEEPPKLGVVPAAEANFIANVREDLEKNKPELLIFPLRYSLPERLQLNPLDYAVAAGWFEVIRWNYHLVMNDSTNVVFRRNMP